MKQIIRLIGVITALFCLNALPSCKKPGCTDEAAVNYNPDAKTDDESCIFPEPDPREPYLGTYLVTDSVFIFGEFSEKKTYTLQITTGGTIQDTISLNNLWNDGQNYIALMAGNTFSIPSQEVSGPYWTSGSGDFTADVITYETSGDAYVNRGTGPKN